MGFPCDVISYIPPLYRLLFTVVISPKQEKFHCDIPIKIKSKITIFHKYVMCMYLFSIIIGITTQTIHFTCHMY